MKTGIKNLTFFIFLIAFNLKCFALSPIEQSHAYIILNINTPDIVKVVTDAANKELKYLSEDFLNIAAEVLSQYHQEKNNKKIKKYLWLLLYNSNNLKYAELLKKVAASSDDSKVRLMRNDASKLFHKAKINSTPQLTPSNVRLQKLKQEHSQLSNATAPNDSARISLSAISLNATADIVFSILGKPHAVDAERIGSLLDKRSRLLWFYQKQGIIVLEKIKGGGAKNQKPELTWRVVDVISDSIGNAYKLKNTGIQNSEVMNENAQLMAILYTEGLGLRKFAELLYKENIQTNTLIKDIAAERLIHDYAITDDKETKKAFVWIAKILERDGNGRYATILNEIIEKTKYLKLKRAANRIGATLTQGSDQYLSGDLNLDKLRKKYSPSQATN